MRLFCTFNHYMLPIFQSNLTGLREIPQYYWSRWRVFISTSSQIQSSVSNRTNHVKLMSEQSQTFVEYAQKIVLEYETHRSENKPLSIMKDASKITEIINAISSINETRKNVESLLDLQEDSAEDSNLQKSIQEELCIYKQELVAAEHMLIELLIPVDDYDNCQNIVIEIGAGAGGQEAMLFSRELLDMYVNYASFKGWQSEMDEIDDTSIGGSRKATLVISGLKAFKLLQFEGGVHRVQRIPKTDNQGRIHTSTVSVAVYPQPTDVDIELKKQDLILEAKTSRGPGGQHVNRIKSAIRITHVPTGITVECQVHRQYEENKKTGLQKLRLKLFQIEEEKANSKYKATKSAQFKTRSRNEKIRTYNFQQDRITDHRFRLTTHNIIGFLQGADHIDRFLSQIQAEYYSRKKNEFLNSMKQ